MKNKELVSKLIEKNYHISFGESCTGGMLASCIVDIPDASKVLNESFVTYADEAKIKYLNVDGDIIKKYGVVSEEVAYQMALGVATNTKSDCAISTTGIAGPTGGSKAKPVGMVCFGFYVNGKIVTKTKHFNGSRNEVRNSATSYAIETMLELIL